MTENDVETANMEVFRRRSRQYGAAVAGLPIYPNCKMADFMGVAR